MPDNQNEQTRSATAQRQVVKYLYSVNREYEQIVAILEDEASSGRVKFKELPDIEALCQSVAIRLSRVKAQTQDIQKMVEATESIELTSDIQALQCHFDGLQKKTSAQLADINVEVARLKTRRWASKSKWAQQQQRPPLNAQFLLYLFLEKGSREEAVGDALEDYSRYIKRVGKLRADIIFLQEVGRCALPFIKRMAARIGGLIVIGEWLRKLTH